MLGERARRQEELFVSGKVKDLIPKDHILKRVDRILDLKRLLEEVKACYGEDNGQPGIAFEVALRLKNVRNQSAGSAVTLPSSTRFRNPIHILTEKEK